MRGSQNRIGLMQASGCDALGRAVVTLSNRPCDMQASIGNSSEAQDSDATFVWHQSSMPREATDLWHCRDSCRSPSQLVTDPWILGIQSISFSSCRDFQISCHPRPFYHFRFSRVVATGCRSNLTISVAGSRLSRSRSTSGSNRSSPRDGHCQFA